MIDIAKQITYWRSSAVEDWEVAQDLINRGRVRHSLFFAHLALEKMLKAHVCQHTQDLAPKVHNLVRLAELADLSLCQTQVDILADMNIFNIEGRYPNTLTPAPAPDEAQDYLQRASEVYQWLMTQL